jgi:hypothetical protein
MGHQFNRRGRADQLKYYFQLDLKLPGSAAYSTDVFPRFTT